jgi:N-acyl-D-aspartate/D-glutamate deacylase
MLGQVVARPVGVLLGLELTLHPFRGCPSYDAIDHLPLGERAREMAKPERRAAILAEFEMPLDPRYPAMMRDIRLFYPMGSNPDYAPPEAMRFEAIAAREGKSLAECAYDALLERDGAEILYLPARNYTDFTLNTVEAMLRREDTVLGLGDGGAHVGAICDGSMPTFLLSHWTKGGKFTIPEAVAMMTGHTAKVSGFGDRGIIAAGMKADLNVIDYDSLKLRAPRAVYDLPAGGRRLEQEATGYRATIVSGVTVARDDQSTGALPGRLVRGRRAGPADVA